MTVSFTQAVAVLAAEPLPARVDAGGPQVSGVLLGLSEPDRAELIGILSPKQVEALERLSRMKFDRK